MMDNNDNQKRIEIKLQRQLNKLVLPILLETLLTFLLGGGGTFMLSQHSDDVVISYSLGADVYFLIKRELTVLEKSRDQGYGEREND